MRMILLIVLILLLLGALPTWPYSTGWGYYPSGGLGLVLLILVVLVLLRSSSLSLFNRLDFHFTNASRAYLRQCSRYAVSWWATSSTTLDHNHEGASSFFE